MNSRKQLSLSFQQILSNFQSHLINGETQLYFTHPAERKKQSNTRFSQKQKTNNSYPKFSVQFLTNLLIMLKLTLEVTMLIISFQKQNAQIGMSEYMGWQSRMGRIQSQKRNKKTKKLKKGQVLQVPFKFFFFFNHEKGTRLLINHLRKFTKAFH